MNLHTKNSHGYDQLSFYSYINKYILGLISQSLQFMADPASAKTEAGLPYVQTSNGVEERQGIRAGKCYLYFTV